MKTLLKPLSFIPALLLMYMIFSFSGQTGDTSSDLSFRVSCKIVSVGNDILGTDLTPDRIEHYAERIEGFVRKLAHVSEYFALAIAVAFPLYVYGVRGLLLMLIAGAFCVAFACGDEFHQSFVSDRSPSKRDVLIDSIGIFFGIIVVRMVGWTGRMALFGPEKTSDAEQQQPWNTYTPNQPPYGNPPPYPPYPDQGMYQNPYVANFDEEDFDNHYEEDYDDDDDLGDGKPFRIFHYDDEYEEEEEETEEDSDSPKSHLFSFKKQNR